MSFISTCVKLQDQSPEAGQKKLACLWIVWDGADAEALWERGKQSWFSGSLRENTPEKNGRKPPGPFDSC